MRVPRNSFEALFPFLGLHMVFIHTPKCGGSFVNNAFGKRFRSCPSIQWKEARGHKTFLEYREIFQNRGENLLNHVLFSVIRNPWDWHLSWYNYISKDVEGRKSGMRIEHEQIKNLSFSDYLLWLEDRDLPASQNSYMRWQISDWLTDENDAVAVPNLLRQERLEEDLLTLQNTYALRLEIQPGERINASRNDPCYQRAYKSSDVDRVAKRHSRDIELFGYSFE